MDKNGDFKESSKDKLNRAIASMCDEWLLIEEIDLEADTFEILHDNLQKQGIPVPRNCSYSQQNFEMQELVAPEYQEYRYNFGVRDNLRKLLKQSDTAECEYIVCTGENVWRRDVFKVVEWKDEEPKILNWFHMNIDSKKSAELKQRQAIRDAYLQSEQAYAIKNMYLKRLNEELQMPINMIVGNASVARTFVTNPERVTACIEEISLSAKAIFRMVRQMINTDAIQQGTTLLQMQQTSVENLWRNTLDIVKPSMRLRRHTMHLDMAQLYHRNVIGDVEKMQQILLNLLQNAIDYTPYQGEIFCGIKEKPMDETTGYFEFYVQDNGVGMSEEFRKIMFEPFAREHSDRIERVEGSGLGLMIVQNLVRLLDGEIEVETKTGHGTKITVGMKLRYGTESKDAAEEIQYFDWSDWESARERKSMFSGQHVLVVDDNDITASIEEQILTERGLVVDRAINGEDAICMFERSPAHYYDLILMDIEMETMNAGILATQEIREADPEAGIIFLTAHETREMIVTAMGAGALDYIVKGCEDEEILYHIRCALKGNPIMSNKIHETVMQEYARLQQSEKSLLFFINNISKLTATEREMIKLLLQGYKVHEIAEARSVEVSTIKTQIKGLLRKFGCSRTKEIVQIIRELNIEHLF